MVKAYLGLGSNMGDKRQMLLEALSLLDAAPSLRVLARSGFYRTPPWGETEQDWFLNAAAAVETSLSPQDFLATCLGVERQLGRVRDRKWGPRLIDIDVLDYGGQTVGDPNLVLPHRYALQRAFVLMPLAELAPYLTIGGIRVTEALARLDRSGIVREPGSAAGLDPGEV
jgi:2-amino-4-hydroxy-6-hydroxymethyldihydropteridine diphosphokinase